MVEVAATDHHRRRRNSSRLLHLVLRGGVSRELGKTCKRSFRDSFIRCKTMKKHPALVLSKLRRPETRYLLCWKYSRTLSPRRRREHAHPSCRVLLKATKPRYSTPKTCLDLLNPPLPLLIERVSERICKVQTELERGICSTLFFYEFSRW